MNGDKIRAFLPPECHPPVSISLGENMQAWSKTNGALGWVYLRTMIGWIVCHTYFNLIRNWLKYFLHPPSVGNLEIARRTQPKHPWRQDVLEKHVFCTDIVLSIKNTNIDIFYKLSVIFSFLFHFFCLGLNDGRFRRDRTPHSICQAPVIFSQTAFKASSSLILNPGTRRILYVWFSRL